MKLLDQGMSISYDPKLEPANRQWVQGVVMYAGLNPGPVTPEWYDDLAAIRLQVLNGKEYDCYQEAEEGIRLVAIAGGKQRTESGHPTLLDHDVIPAAGGGGVTADGPGIEAEEAI